MPEIRIVGYNFLLGSGKFLIPTHKTSGAPLSPFTPRDTLGGKLYLSFMIPAPSGSHLTLCLLSHYPPGTLNHSLGFLRVLEEILLQFSGCPKHLLVIEGNYQTFQQKIFFT
jgi:hypothetical protein